MFNFPQKASLAVVFLLGMVSCTNPPEKPRLARLASGGKGLILHDTLTVQNVREIFGVMNSTGKLDALKPWIEEASDDQLKTIADLATTYLYKESDLDGGLLEILRSRMARRGFEDWRKKIAQWAESDGFRDQTQALRALTQFSDFVETVERDIPFLNSDWAELTLKIKIGARSFFTSKKWDTERGPSTAMLLADLEKILKNPALRNGTIEMAGHFETASLGEALLRTTTHLSRQQRARYIEGFVYSLRELVKQIVPQDNGTHPNKFELMLQFAQTTDESSSVILKSFSERPKLLLALVSELRGAILRAMAAAMRDRILTPQPAAPEKFFVQLKDGKAAASPSEQLKFLFSRFRMATEEFVGSVRQERSEEAFYFNLPVYLNTYVLSRYLEHVVAHANVKNLAALTPTDFWDLRIEPPPPFKIDFAEKDTAGKYIHLERLAQVIPNADFRRHFIDVLGDKIRKNVIYENLVYEIDLEEPMVVRDALAKAIAACDGVRRIDGDSTDPTRWLLSLIQRNTSAETRIAGANPKNLLDTLHHIIGAVEIEDFRELKRLVFDEMKLGALPANEKEKILSQLSVANGLDPKLLPAARKILNSAQMVAEFDRSFQGLPTAFEFYQSATKRVRPLEISGLRNLLSYASRSQFLSLAENAEGKATPLFPSAYHAVRSGDFLGRLLTGLAAIDEEEIPLFLAPLRHAFGQPSRFARGKNWSRPGGIEFHLNLLEKWLALERQGIQKLFAFIESKGWDIWPDTSFLTEAERTWAIRFVDKGDFRKFWAFAAKPDSRDQLQNLLGSLRRLKSQGNLSQALSLLSRIQNSRIQQIGEVVQKWVDGDDFSPFLDTFEMLLK